MSRLANALLSFVGAVVVALWLLGTFGLIDFGMYALPVGQLPRACSR